MLRVKDSRELQAAALSMKRAQKEVRSIVGKETRATFGKEWRKQVQAASGRSPRPQQRAALLKAGVNVTGTNPPTATAYASAGKLSGGLSNTSYQAVEYGSDQRPQLPPRSKGHALSSALALMAPRVASYWVQSIVRAYARAAEGR